MVVLYNPNDRLLLSTYCISGPTKMHLSHLHLQGVKLTSELLGWDPLLCSHVALFATAALSQYLSQQGP